MKNYFLISEFAKLRDININSLRYYEKLGLLKPAYVDENTGYRYYSAEQLPLLNKIILCVQLGIPLKDMASCMDEEGNLQSKKLLLMGKETAQKRMEELQQNLKYIETSLNSMEENKEFAGRKGIYYRQIGARKIIATEFYEDGQDYKEIVSIVAEIYKSAQREGLFPILPAGQILEIECDGTIRIRFFLEVLNGVGEHPMVQELPAGEYSCMQTELWPEMDLMKEIRENWKTNEKMTIIINNITLEKYSFETRPSELQRWERKIQLTND